jgi:hypothetical protein
MNIPEKINNFNAYLGSVEEATRLVGITDEVTLPDLTNLTESLSLAGMPGSIDSPVLGQYDSMTIEIPFANITTQMLDIAAQDSEPIILRAAQEVVDTATNIKSMKSIVITVRGMTKSIKYGSLKKGGFGNPSLTKEITYYKDEYDGSTLTEIDKWNAGCVVNGVDIGKEIQDLI